MTKRKTITLQVYSLCQGVQCKLQVSIHKLLQYTKYTSFKYTPSFLVIQYILYKIPEANILVCKGYKCTKNQAPDYIPCKIKWLVAAIIISNSLDRSNNLHIQLHAALLRQLFNLVADMLIGIMQSSIYDINHIRMSQIWASITQSQIAACIISVWQNTLYQQHTLYQFSLYQFGTREKLGF